MQVDTYTRRLNRGEETIDIVVHRAEVPAILVNVPGYGGSIDGYNRKYVTLCDDVAAREIAACVRMPNVVRPRDVYARSLCDDIRAVCAYVREHSIVISDYQYPRLYLMGFSAGASAVAALAAELEVDAVLLMAPSFDAGEASVEAITRYRGELYIVVGSDDEVVGQQPARTYLWKAENARYRRLVTLPACDHQFRGERNGLIVSKAPRWAFAGDGSFPSPRGGIKLY